MFRRFIIAALLCLPMFAFAKSPLSTLQGAQSKLESTLENAPEKGTTESKKRRATLDAEAKKLFDFETLAQKALSKNWETGTAEQQAEFIDLFSYLVRDTYLDQIEGNSAKGFSVNWGSESITGETAVVNANVTGKTAEGKSVNIKLVYKLINKGGNWMVFDVITDDSSLLDTYKDTFSKMFKKEGSFDGVLIKLRAKTGRKAPAPKAEAPVEGFAPITKPAPPVKVTPKAEAPKVEVKTTKKIETRSAKVNPFGVFFFKLPVALFAPAAQFEIVNHVSFVGTVTTHIFASLKLFTLTAKNI
jgi:phospholipid transport system substrate-binding protein